MDLRNWPVSHALDDVMSVCSFDDDGSLEGDVGSLAAGQLLKHDERVPLVDAYAFVDDAKKERKASRSNSRSSSAIKTLPPVPSSTATVVTVAAPSKPLKWQLRLADRATAGVKLEAHYQLPPHVLFDLLADPLQHESIFDEIVSASAELLEDEGPRRKWRLDYMARWSFWKVSGICENRLFMWTDRDNGTVTFKLREPGFLRRYEGTWTIKPACGTPMAECYPAAAPAGESLSPSEYSSSAGSSPASSRSSSPMRGGGMRPDQVMNSSSNSGKVGLQRLLAPFGSSNDEEVGEGSSSSGGGALGGFLRVTPLASVNLMSQQGMPAAAGVGSSSSDGRSSSPMRLTGAVAAIFRMQEAFQQSVSSSVANLTSFGSSNASSSNSGGAATFLGGIGDRISGMLPQLPNGGGPSVQGSLARGSPPWSGLLPNNNGNSNSSSGSRDAGGQEQRQQQRRRPLPTAAIITADCLTSPSVTPPYPLNQILKTHSKGQVQEMLNGLVKAAAAAAAAAGAAQ